jgi:uncharacterized protein
MMELIIISVAAFFTSILTFYSGFGLGTLLMPLFALFFPIDIAIALTGVVHFINNLFKLFLVGRKTDKTVLLYFGIPAIIASFAGALLLIRISHVEPIIIYQLFDKTFEVTFIKVVIAIILLFFALFEIIPMLQRIQFGGKQLIAGGLLSGFFGGLSGMQGALRSAFLIKSGLSKESYIATGVVIALVVDVSRISVYVGNFASSGLNQNLILVIAATLSAIVGAFYANKILHKVTFKSVQKIVALMLIILSFALGFGMV